MSFWATTWSNVLGGVFAGFVLVLVYVVIQLFLRATDLVITYNWRFDTVNGLTRFRPNFDIRNRSGSKTYRLSNIAYTVQSRVHWFDNESLWGAVLEPESINNRFEVAPVKGIHSLHDALMLEITIRTQGGRSFWLRGQGPGQMGRGRTQRFLFWLRNKVDSSLIPME